jgi:hypothetical protein
VRRLSQLSCGDFELVVSRIVHGRLDDGERMKLQVCEGDLLDQVKTAESSPSALRYPSELQLLIDPRKLIQCRPAALAIFLIELDQASK